MGTKCPVFIGPSEFLTITEVYHIYCSISLLQFLLSFVLHAYLNILHLCFCITSCADIVPVAVCRDAPWVLISWTLYDPNFDRDTVVLMQ